MRHLEAPIRVLRLDPCLSRSAANAAIVRGMPNSASSTSGSNAAIDPFIAYWQGQDGGQERANYQLSLIDLAEALGLPRPEAAGPNTETNTYVFERAVTFR